MKKTKLFGSPVLLACSVVAGSLLCASSANADLILINSPASTSLATGGVAGTGVDSGTLVGGPLSVPFAFGAGGEDTGTLTSAVYSGDTFNTLGGLTYIYTISVTGGDVNSVQLSGAWGTQVEVGFGMAGSTPSDGAITPGNVSFGYWPFVARNDGVSGGRHFLNVIPTDFGNADR